MTDPNEKNPHVTPVVSRVLGLRHRRGDLLAVRRSLQDPEGADPRAIALIGDVAGRPGTDRGIADYRIAALLADHLNRKGFASAEGVWSVGTVVRGIRDKNLRATCERILTRSPRTAVLEALPRVLAIIDRSGSRTPIPWSSLHRDLQVADHEFAGVQRRWAYDIHRIDPDRDPAVLSR